MSTAPSSVPPPSFGLAPELPEGVERKPPPEAPRWKAWTAWVGLIAAFAGALMGALIVGVIGAAAGADLSDPTPAVNISATIVQDLSFIAAALLFASIAGRPLPEQFGLRPTRLWPAVGWMAVAFVSFYVVTATWVAILGVDTDDSKLPDELGVEGQHRRAARRGLPGRPSSPRSPRSSSSAASSSPRCARGRGCGRRRSSPALVFGGIHVGSAEAAFLLPLGFFGFCLCLLYHRTGSLYPCIALHCVNNSLAFGVSQHWGWETAVLFVVRAVDHHAASRAWSARRGRRRPRPPADRLAGRAVWSDCLHRYISAPCTNGAVCSSVLILMAAPSAASAATGPLLSLTPERVANGHLALAGPAVARARGHAALGRGPDRDRALLPPRPQAARGQRQPPGVVDGQVGVRARRLPDLQAGRRADQGDAPRDADGAPARGQAGAGRRRGAQGRPGRARPGGAPAPAAPGGQGLRRRPARPLRRSAPRAPSSPSAR